MGCTTLHAGIVAQWFEILLRLLLLLFVLFVFCLFWFFWCFFKDTLRLSSMGFYFV